MGSDLGVGSHPRGKNRLGRTSNLDVLVGERNGVGARQILRDSWHRRLTEIFEPPCPSSVSHSGLLKGLPHSPGHVLEGRGLDPWPLPLGGHHGPSSRTPHSKSVVQLGGLRPPLWILFGDRPAPTRPAAHLLGGGSSTLRRLPRPEASPRAAFEWLPAQPSGAGIAPAPAPIPRFRGQPPAEDPQSGKPGRRRGRMPASDLAAPPSELT